MPTSRVAQGVRLLVETAATVDAQEIRMQPVQGISGAGRYVIDGATVSAVGTARLAVGQIVPVVFESGRPLVIFALEWQRGRGEVGQEPALGVVEELLLVTVSGQQRLYFRNDQQITDLGLSVLVTGQGAPTFGVVRWGQRDDTFYLKTEQTPPRYFIFQLGRAPGAVYGAAPASARLLRVITMPTIALPAAMHTVTATPPPFSSTSFPFTGWRTYTLTTTPTAFPANASILDAVLSQTDDGDVDVVVLATVNVLKEEAYPMYSIFPRVTRFGYLFAVRPSTDTILWTSPLTAQMQAGAPSPTIYFADGAGGNLGTSKTFTPATPPPEGVAHTVALPQTTTTPEITLEEATLLRWDLRAGGQRLVVARWTRGHNLNSSGLRTFLLYPYSYGTAPDLHVSYFTDLEALPSGIGAVVGGSPGVWIRWAASTPESAFMLEGPAGQVMLSDWGEPSAILASQSRPFTPASLLWLRPATLGSAELFLTTLASGLSRMIVRDPAGIGGPFGRVSGLRLMAPDLAYAITEAAASETRPAEREHFVAWPPAASAGPSFLAPTATGAASFARAATTPEAEALRAKPADFPVDVVDFAYHAVATGG